MKAHPKIVAVLAAFAVALVFWYRHSSEASKPDLPPTTVEDAEYAERAAAKPGRGTASRPANHNDAIRVTSPALERARAQGFPEERVYVSSVENKWRDTATEFGLDQEESDRAWGVIQTFRGRLYQFAVEQLRRGVPLEAIDFTRLLVTDPELVAAREQAVKELATLVPDAARVGLIKTEPLLFPDEPAAVVEQGPVPAEPGPPPPPPKRL